MEFEKVTLAAWRAQVEKELAGAPFDKTLVHTTPEGLAVQPLYTEAAAPASPTGVPGGAPFTRGASAQAAPFRVCMRHEGSVDARALEEDLTGGAEGLWLDAGPGLEAIIARADPRAVTLVIDGGSALATLAVLCEGATKSSVPMDARSFVLGHDPIAQYAQGGALSGSLEDSLAEVGAVAKLVSKRAPFACGATVSTLPYASAGADAAEELAIALSTGVAYLRSLVSAGFDAKHAARQIAVRVSVGRDTFGELCKLRALRLCWHKLFAAAGAPDAPLAMLHAVCSPVTLSERDPWVNMLRVSTQVTAAVLGGATLVTPQTYDAALGAPGALGRRVARNTCLVLREESHLGRVVDPAGGSYYLEARTDALARQAWGRFRAIESEGGIVAVLANGSLRARLDASWKARQEAVAKRKSPVLGVSEFANTSEPVPQRSPRSTEPAALEPVPSVGAPLLRAVETSQGNARLDALLSASRAGVRYGALARACARIATTGPLAPLPVHRDAESFEALRDRADERTAEGTLPKVSLVTLGPPAEHRARLGFASSFFATGGLVATEGEAFAPDAVACLCGSDERYAAEAAARARELKAKGFARVLLAGRPGALEASLREAGVDGFIFMGCDVVAALSDILLGVRA